MQKIKFYSLAWLHCSNTLHTGYTLMPCSASKLVSHPSDLSQINLKQGGRATCGRCNDAKVLHGLIIHY